MNSSNYVANGVGTGAAGAFGSSLPSWAQYGAGGIGAGFLGGMSGNLGGSLFPQYQNPANAAFPYANQAINQLPQYAQPYMTQGGNAFNTAGNEFGWISQHPGETLNSFGSGYKQSPGYQWQLGQGEQAISNAADAGGMQGSMQHQQQAGQLAENMANQDYYNYLNHVTSMFDTGLQGDLGLGQIGAQTSMGLGENIANILGAEGQYAYAGAQGQNMANQQNANNLWSGIGSLGSAIASFL